MSKVSHTRRKPRSRSPRVTASAARPIRPSVGAVIQREARRLQRAQVYFGHGTDNAIDDAAALVWHVMDLPLDAPATVYNRKVSLAAEAALKSLVSRRIRERVPAVYLTGTTWFAGLPFFVDERVLIPRSPIAELIERRFSPWIQTSRVRRILDLGTGSGCIAIAAAKAFPKAQVDASDVSADALEVAAINVRRHRVGKRVRLVESDHFAALAGQTYDIIVTNPPYVGAAELESLPLEYWHEPRLALASGRDGLDSVRVLLAEARRYLNPSGLLVVEVGNTEVLVRRRFPRWPFKWLEFERGGGGVFLLTAEDLDAVMEAGHVG